MLTKKKVNQNITTKRIFCVIFLIYFNLCLLTNPYQSLVLENGHINKLALCAIRRVFIVFLPVLFSSLLFSVKQIKVKVKPYKTLTIYNWIWHIHPPQAQMALAISNILHCPKLSLSRNNFRPRISTSLRLFIFPTPLLTTKKSKQNSLVFPYLHGTYRCGLLIKCNLVWIFRFPKTAAWNGRKIICAASSAAGSSNPDGDLNPYEVKIALYLVHT